MTGQNKMIEEANKNKKVSFTKDELGIATNNGAYIHPVVQHANEIENGRRNMS